MLSNSDQQKLAAALHSQEQPPGAAEVLGYSDQQLAQIRKYSGGLAELINILPAIGIDNYCHQQQGTREILLVRPLAAIDLPRAIESRQQQAAKRIAQHLLTIVPEDERLLVLFSPFPDSALFSLLPEDQLIVFIPDIDGRSAAPGKNWQPVSGGWKKNNFLALEQSFFLRSEPGLLTARNITTHSAQWKELCAEHWPDPEVSQRRQRAVKQLRKIDHCQQLIDQYQQYCQEQSYDLQSQAEEVEDLQAEMISWQEQISDLTDQLQNARRYQQQVSGDLQQQQSTLASLIANKDLDRRQKITAGCQLISQAQQIARLDQVLSAEAIDPLGADPELYVRCQLAPEQEIIEFTVSGGQILIAEQYSILLASRQLAIADNFASGQWLTMSKIILGSLQQAG